MRTRMSIMESALDIFSEKNFANASVSEITARIGLSKGAFYWHFKNKQDILIKIIEEFCAGDCDKYMGLCEASPEAVGSLTSGRRTSASASTRFFTRRGPATSSRWRRT